jgi:hypothetical protein
MVGLSVEEQLEVLHRQIQERALRLADLEVIIHDYRRERQQLLEEIVELKQQFWDLMGGQDEVKRET